ncbi:MAG TPA: hypothetical protein VF381_11175 [Thermoanaerobaculia bacterium]
MSLPLTPRLVLCALVVGLGVQTALAQSAAVSVLKTASPEPVNSGATLTYTITVGNEGPDPAANVTLSDPLPPGVLFQSISPNAGWNCATPAVGSNGTVSCSTATFATGGVVFTLVTTVSPSVSDGTVLSNVATVSSTTPDPDSNDNSSEADSTVVAPSSPTLTITKSGAPDPVTAGTNLTYTITASNNGTVALDAAAIRDTLPPSTTFVSIAPAAGWSCSGTSSITCSAPGMPASSSADFTLVVKVDPATPAGNVTNQAFFDTTVGGRDSTISTSVSTQVVVSADLSVTKSDAPDPVIAGSNITYTITVTNPGPSTAASVTLSDTIPALTSFVSLVPAAGWSCSGTSTISCSIASMPAGSASFQLTVKTSPSAAGTTVSNTATVSSPSDTNNANNSATATTTVNILPSQIPLLGVRELMMLALMLASVAVLALKR